MSQIQNPLCNSRKISEIRRKYGFSFSKSLSQNFLTDPEIPEQMAEEAGIDRETGVLEIGPGIGALTFSLASHAYAVVALEADPTLPPVLAETLASFDNVHILPGDALRRDFDALSLEYFGDRRTLLCANLPYHITTEAVEKLLATKKIEAAYFMVQKEAGERLTAAPGEKGCSEISYLIAYHFEAKLLFLVPRDRFEPAPHVDSAVIALRRRESPAVSPKDPALMFSLIKTAFGKRRKTISNALAGFMDQSKENLLAALAEAGISPTERGERIDLIRFAALSDAISRKK